MRVYPLRMSWMPTVDAIEVAEFAVDGGTSLAVSAGGGGEGARVALRHLVGKLEFEADEVHPPRA